MESSLRLPQRRTVRQTMTKLRIRKDTERQATLNLSPIFKIVPKTLKGRIIFLIAILMLIVMWLSGLIMSMTMYSC
jgi:hypothetical protein